MNWLARIMGRLPKSQDQPKATVQSQDETEENYIPGWSSLVEWFGQAPDFHDAEVVSIDLRRDPEPSFLRVNACRTLWDIVDENGFYRTDRHAIVTFTINGIAALSLTGWAQNVLDDLTIDQNEDGFTLRMPTIYGVEGEISAKSISVAVEPRGP